MRKLAIKTRSNKIETEHYGYIALTDSQAKPDKTLNDDKDFFVRSCIKPIQAKVCKDILKDDLEDEFLTMAVASHLSTESQISLLKEMLNKYGVDEENLHCGLKSQTNKQVFKSKIYHNCAGKHITHLAAVKKAKLKSNYYEFEHSIQQATYKELLNLSKKDMIETGIDGCGLPTFYMSLIELASSFSRANQIDSYKKIFATVNKHAHLISDSSRFDQELMCQFPNKFFAKSGADGMMLVLNLKTSETLVIKVIDGEKRVKDIVAKKLLENLSWLKPEELQLDNTVYNSLGHATGTLTGLDFS